MHDDQLAVLANLAICLVTALVFGYLTFRLRLSPIVGYLLAGVLLGPKTPGFVAQQATASQFAEIGVVLLMFGVGLHFNLGDLMAVRRIAVPGALGQVTAATVAGVLAVVAAGWGWTAGTVIGLSLSVASTVVLIRMLSEYRVLDTEQGHIAVGWLIVEDLFTVLVLVMLPAVAATLNAEGRDPFRLLLSFSLAIVKISALALIVLWGGRKIIPRVLERIARTRTRELFTLTILAVALSIATGSAYVFGVSIALGAFMAGMVVGQSEVSHQAAADALPMRDAFAVLFFVSVGMLFDYRAVAANPVLFAALLAVILLAKPIAAFAILWFLRHPVRTAITVSVALAQIGEFSFILASLASDLKLLDARGQSLLVACAIVSISLNPLLFRAIRPVELWLRQQPQLWKLISARSDVRKRTAALRLPKPESDIDGTRAIVVGYGPVGKAVASILNDFGITPVIVDLNVNTVTEITRSGGLAIYGDASQRDILSAAGIARASYLLVTVPDLETRTVVAIVARELNPDVKIFVRARYFAERAWLAEIGADQVCFEELEASLGLSRLLLEEIGADEERLRAELRAIRDRWSLAEAHDNETS